MKEKIFLIVLLILGIGAFTLPRWVGAAPAAKFFVCKYVGQPGVDEHLQTGQNPISVSGNALPNGTGVGDSFADQQGRSFVIAEDTGQDEPTCPAGDTPPVDEPPVDEPPVVEDEPETPAETPTTTETPSLK